MYCTIEATYTYLVRNANSVTLTQLRRRATSLGAYQFIHPWQTPKIDPRTAVNKNAKLNMQPEHAKLYDDLTVSGSHWQ